MDLEWMVREAASGRAWRGRQHRGGTELAVATAATASRQRLWHEEWGLYRDGIVDISCSERAEWK